LTGPKHLPVLFLDGEGGDRPDGSHAYMVLCAWSAHTGPLILRNDDGSELGTRQILDWLLDLRARLKAEDAPHDFVGFGIGYDLAMILKDLPERPAQRFYRPDKMGWVNEKGMMRWVVVGPYMFRQLGSEFICCEATKGPGARATKDTRRSFSLWDTFKFFQGSFVKALTNWQILPPDELAAMEAMKRKRSTFQADEIDQEIIDYCLSECRAGVALITKLRDTCADLGYPLERYDGAGSLAAAMLKAWGIADYMADVPEKMRRAVACAYFGGRFEICHIGRYYGPVWQNDINSAYPYIIQSLPCLAHAEWKASKHVQSDGLYQVEWKYADPCYWGGLPHRDRQGTITYPLSGIGWYWGSEVLAAERLHPGSHTIRRGWALNRLCDHTPFNTVPSVYRQRLRLGSTAAGTILKLGLNSLYGKTAQSVGQPKYANYIWAGMITAGCRAMILDAIREAGAEQVMAVATDAIVTTAPVALPSSPGKVLGEWDATTSDGGILVIQPGITINYDAHGVGTYKSRGLGKAEFAAHAKAAEQAWTVMGIVGAFRANSHRFVGIKAALARNRFEERCRWVSVSTALRYYPGKKRYVKDDQLLAHLNKEPVHSVAPSGQEEPSQPYKHILRRLTESYAADLWVNEQPAPECELLELAGMWGDL
jgi:hypothetical protein